MTAKTTRTVSVIDMASKNVEVEVQYPYYRKKKSYGFVTGVEHVTDTMICTVHILPPGIEFTHNMNTAIAEKGGLDYLLGRGEYAATAEEFEGALNHVVDRALNPNKRA